MMLKHLLSSCLPAFKSAPRSALCSTLGTALGTALAITLALALAPSSAFAHEDRAIQIRPDGTLDGLAPAYAPARLRLAFAPVDGEPRVSALALELHGRRVELPMCVLGLLNTERAADVQASASWEHDETILPPYLSLRFLDPGQDPKAAATSAFSLLFDLRSAKLIEMQVEIVHAARHRTQSVPVDLQARCGDAETASFLAPAR
jgi:hypothetical protein